MATPVAISTNWHTAEVPRTHEERRDYTGHLIRILASLILCGMIRAILLQQDTVQKSDTETLNLGFMPNHSADLPKLGS